jgi:hypothetical protein
MPALGESSGAPERYVTIQTGSSSCWGGSPDGFAIEANGYTTIRVVRWRTPPAIASSYAEATARVDKLAPVVGEADRATAAAACAWVCP